MVHFRGEMRRGSERRRAKAYKKNTDVESVTEMQVASQDATQDDSCIHFPKTKKRRRETLDTLLQNQDTTEPALLPKLGEEVRRPHFSKYIFFEQTCAVLLTEIQQYITRKPQASELSTDRISGLNCNDIVSTSILNYIANQYITLYKINRSAVNCANILLSITAYQTNVTLLEHFVHSAASNENQSANNFLLVAKFLMFMSCYCSARISFEYISANPIMAQYQEIFKSKCADSTKILQRKFFEACAERNYSSVESILVSQQDYHLIADAIDDQSGHTPLYNACISGDLKLIQILLTYGASPYFYSVNNCNILHIFFTSGHSIDHVKNLFNMRVHGKPAVLHLMQQRDLFGHLPLYRATEHCSFEVMQYLLSLRDTKLVNIIDIKNMHVLSLACILGKNRLVKMLVAKHKMLLEIPDSLNNLPLHIATLKQYFNEERFDIIYSNTQKAWRIDCNKDGYNFMHIAFIESNINAIRYMGDNHNAQFKKIIVEIGGCGYAPLYYLNAANNQFVNIISYLCSIKISFAFFDGDGATIIHRLILRKDFKAALMLLQSIHTHNCEFDPTLEDSNKNSALYLAAYNGMHNLIDILLKIGEKYQNKIKIQYNMVHDGLNALYGAVLDSKHRLDRSCLLLRSKFVIQNVYLAPQSQSQAQNPTWPTPLIAHVGLQGEQQRRYSAPCAVPQRTYQREGAPRYFAHENTNDASLDLRNLSSVDLVQQTDEQPPNVDVGSQLSTNWLDAQDKGAEQGVFAIIDNELEGDKELEQFFDFNTLNQESKGLDIGSQDDERSL